MTAFRSCVRELTEKKRIISARMTKPMTDFIMLINGRNAFSSSHPFLVPSGIISCPRSPVNKISEKSNDHMVKKAYNSSRVQEVHEMKREETNQQTRSNIVNGAIREFSEHGFEAGSLNVICEEQGISKGIIYHYFPSKEMLYLECIRTCQQEMIRYLNDHLQNQEGNLLKEFFDCRSEYYRLHPDDARLFESAVLDYHLIASAGLYTFVYIAARAAGKYFGARFGAKATHLPETVQKYLGLTLLPHSGVSLVFTGIICAVLEPVRPDLASIVKGTIAAAVVINEIIAVLAARKGFELAGETPEEPQKLETKYAH